MTTSPVEHWPAMAKTVQVTGDTLTVDLTDGRSISVPLAWYPRLVSGTATDRANWQVIGRGEGIHWPDLDEHISVDNLLSGARSGESQRSFKKRLATRPAATGSASCGNLDRTTPMAQTVELMKRITVNPDQCGGRPCIRGQRIGVNDVLELLAAGESREQILEDYPYLEPEDITASLLYAARRMRHPNVAT